MITETFPHTTEAAWLELRKQDITSTESAALFGLSPYLTQFELYHRKRTGDVPEFVWNERMEWGNQLEAAIAAGIAREQGWTIEPMKSYQRITGERIGSSFDFVITNLPDGPAHLEIKNVDYLAFRDGWIIDEDGMHEAPAHIEMQVQHQMLVSGFNKAFIGALIGGNRGIIIERPRDEPVIAAIRAACQKFWNDIETGNEPAPIMPGDAEAVIRLNQHAEPGKILDASGDEKIASLVAEYKRLCAERDTADEAAKVIKAEILIAIGDAEKCLLDGWTISAGLVAETPPTMITAEMVGTTYGGRKGFRNCRITKRKESK